MSVSGRSSVTLLLLGVSLFLVGPCRSGCRDAGLCCTGRDPSCISEGWRSDRSHGTCYCDQACVSTMDCCHDYETACPAVSCVVSEWTEWSGCAESCRATVRRRSRTILQEPLNAGKPCPSLEEHAGCAEYSSQQGHCQNSLGFKYQKCPFWLKKKVKMTTIECRTRDFKTVVHNSMGDVTVVPALITTGGYGNARKKRDIPVSSGVTGYCVQFQLTSLTKGCQQSEGPHTLWMQYLMEGHHVCVECQPPALAAGQKHCAGDGEEIEDRKQSLQWQAVGNPRCRGVWRRVGRLEACSCPTAHSFLFI